jgi:membrane protein YqaA with SNARE-associated domain
MEAWLSAQLELLLSWLALPEFGLSTLFAVSFVSATLLPLGSEPALFGLLKLNPELMWPALAVATAGNTLGGMLNYWIGYGAKRAVVHIQHEEKKTHAWRWLERFGPKALLLSWLPVVGDPLCSVAGWLKMRFWPCVLYMAIGKLLRYLIYTFALLWFFPGPWKH